MTEQIDVDGRTVEISHPDKVLFPGDEITKRNLVEYYRRIGDVILPHMAGRPISMQRFPDGIGEEGFYQKEVPGYFPPWIARAEVTVREDGSQQPQVVCDSTATLVYLASQSCITPHIWLSRQDRLDYPDRLVFDLDPPAGDFESVRRAAKTLRGLLQSAGLTPFVMTTGSRGLHVVAPIKRDRPFDDVRAYARRMVEQLAQKEPDRLTVEMAKADRRGRLFLDYLRNAYGQTTVTPYAVRAKPGAPVATPLDWDELHDSSLHSQSYTIDNIFRRLGQKADPWRDMQKHAVSLPQLAAGAVS